MLVVYGSLLTCAFKLRNIVDLFYSNFVELVIVLFSYLFELLNVLILDAGLLFFKLSELATLLFSNNLKLCA